MKNRIIAVLFALVFAISAFAVPASAASPYQTYTYSINGTALYSPDAYTPTKSIDSAYMGLTDKKIMAKHYPGLSSAELAKKAVALGNQIGRAHV